METLSFSGLVGDPGRARSSAVALPRSRWRLGPGRAPSRCRLSSPKPRSGRPRSAWSAVPGARRDAGNPLKSPAPDVTAAWYIRSLGHVDFAPSCGDAATRGRHGGSRQDLYRVGIAFRRRRQAAPAFGLGPRLHHLARRLRRCDRQLRERLIRQSRGRLVSNIGLAGLRGAEHRKAGDRWGGNVGYRHHWAPNCAPTSVPASTRRHQYSPRRGVQRCEYGRGAHRAPGRGAGGCGLNKESSPRPPT